MPQQITPFSITAPGFHGLNLQDSPIGMDSGFALIANNCVIDQSGRVAARKGWDKAHTSNAQLSTSDVTCIGEVIQTDGTATIVATGGAYLFKHSGTTLTTLTYGGGGVAPTISASNWQFCQLNGVGIFWQRGYDPLIYDPAVSTTTFRRLNEKTGSLGTVQQANTAISAFGRIWCGDLTSDRNTLYWSDVLTPHIWSGGSSGSLNLHGVWPKGGDNIVALAAHNNYLFIFGRYQTLVYSGATTPSTMALTDTLEIGCIARDSVQNTGQDVIFLSDSGVRGVLRTIQENSAPLRDLSMNVRNELLTDIMAETLANVKSAYSPTNAFYLLTMPTRNRVYCFDMRSQLPTGAARVTTWSVITPKSFWQSSTRKLYIGKAGYIGEYAGYLDDTSEYRISYYTPWIDFGNPIQTSILKKILLTVIGATNQSIVFKWAYDFDTTYFSETATISEAYSVSEYNVAEYNIGQYGGGGSVTTTTVNGSGKGVLIQFGFEAQINDNALSFQKISIYTKEGRL